MNVELIAIAVFHVSFVAGFVGLFVFQGIIRLFLRQQSSPESRYFPLLQAVYYFDNPCDGTRGSFMFPGSRGESAACELGFRGMLGWKMFLVFWLWRISFVSFVIGVFGTIITSQAKT